MNKAFLLITVLIAAAIAGFSASSFAQDPFGDAAVEAPDEAAAGVENAAAEANPPAGQAAPVKSSGDATDAVDEEPAVVAILESNPTTPEQLVRAVDTLVRLKRPALAAPMLAKLTVAPLDEQAMVVLVEKAHSATLLRLAGYPELQPAAAEFVDRVLRGAAAYRQNAERLGVWASQLAGGTEAEAADARYQLLQAHSAAVAPLVRQYAAPGNAAGAQTRIDAVVRELTDDAVGPLIGYIEGTDEQVRLTAIHLLAVLRSREAVEFLVGPAVAEPNKSVRSAAAAALRRITGKTTTPNDAAILLERETLAKLSQALRGVGQPDRTVQLWRWSAEHNESVPVSYRADDAALATAARLGKALHQVSPANAEYRRLYLIALLADAQVRAGLDQALPAEKGEAYADAVAFGPAVIDDVLAEALRTNQRYAAIAACQILGDIGSEKLLTRGGEVASPLAKSVAHDDRRIRFRAVEAVLSLQPTQAFVGSSHVTEALGYFSAATGARRVLIVHPRSQMGQQLAGILREQGFEADLATNGRDAFRMATTNPDYEFALVHMAVGNPRIEELLAQFRRDRRSIRLPVGIVAVADNTQPATRLAKYAQPATSLVHPAGLAPMQREAGALLGKVARDLVPVEVRQYQAEVMLDRVVHLASSSQKVFDLRQLIPAVEQSLRNPRLAVRAALVLGHLGSANGQRSLVSLAARSTQPLPVREAAVTAFQGSVLRHGLLLTKDEVQAQYNQYNINAGRDQDLHRLLATILDTIEGPPTETSVAPQHSVPQPNTAAPTSNL